jgi:hypothetical protein
MKQILFILLFSIVPLSWAEECYEGSQIQIIGKIVSVEREALPELDAETGIFSSKGMKTIYLLETNDPVCFSTSNGMINNSETKQIQLVLKDSQKSEFKNLEGKQVSLIVEGYYEGLTQHTIRVVVFEKIRVLAWMEGSDELVFPFEVYPKVLEPNARIAQSTIMHELCDDDSDSTFCKADIPNDCSPSGRGWFPIFTNKEGKIIDIGSNPEDEYTKCQSKEEFNICTAKPEGWDLSLVEKEEICFGY